MHRVDMGKSSCHFCRLPPEIRTTIYRLIFDWPLNALYRSTTPPDIYAQLDKLLPPTSSLLTPLFTCRAFYYEARDIASGHVPLIFRVSKSPSPQAWWDARLAHASALSRARSAVRHVVLSGRAYEYFFAGQTYENPVTWRRIESCGLVGAETLTLHRTSAECMDYDCAILICVQLFPKLKRIPLMRQEQVRAEMGLARDYLQDVRCKLEETIFKRIADTVTSEGKAEVSVEEPSMQLLEVEHRVPAVIEISDRGSEEVRRVSIFLGSFDEVKMFVLGGEHIVNCGSVHRSSSLKVVLPTAHHLITMKRTKWWP